MGINLSIKNVPAEQVERLKAQAKRNHRSLQGELRAIVDEALNAPTAAPRKKKTVREIAEYVAGLGLTSANEATAWIREDRDR